METQEVKPVDGQRKKPLERATDFFKLLTAIAVLLKVSLELLEKFF